MNWCIYNQKLIPGDIYPGEFVPDAFQRSLAVAVHPPFTEQALQKGQRGTDKKTASGSGILV